MRKHMGTLITRQPGIKAKFKNTDKALLRGPVAQPGWSALGQEAPRMADNREVPGSNPGGPTNSLT
ncbi:hypothetical protein JCM14467A_17510 [Vulcanisaeta sp. JCM 14467]